MDCQNNHIDIQHDFYHSQDTKIVLQEADRMHSDSGPFSSYTVETDITELYLLEIYRHTLRHVLKSAQDIDWITWCRINKFWHVEYELQRTILLETTIVKMTS